MPLFKTTMKFSSPQCPLASCSAIHFISTHFLAVKREIATNIIKTAKQPLN